MKSTHHNSTQESSKDYSHLVGIDYSELNCWELARKFYSDVLDKELIDPYIPEERNRVEDSKVALSQKEYFKRIETPEFGDLILIHVYGLPAHIDIYLKGDLFLHSSKNTGSVIGRLTRYRTKIEGYYRWQD